MPFIRTTPAAEATGAVRQMYERQQSSWGFVPNYARVFCHRPAVMKLWADLQSGIRQPVDSRRFELVTFAAALALRSSYCSLAHGDRLRKMVTDEDILSIVETGSETHRVAEPSAAGAEPTGITAAEREMMRYAAKVAKDATAVTAGDVARLHAHGYTDAEIFDIAALAAARAFFTKLVEALGAEPDSSFLDMDEQLRDSLTVGRPIDFARTQRVETATRECQLPA